MGKIKTGDNTRFFRIELNDYGDYVLVPIGNDAFFDCFAKGCKQMWAMAGKTCRKLEKIERERKNLKNFELDLEKIKEAVEINVQFSENATNIIDNIFGEGTIRKYFRKFYEKEPDFMPNADCFTDFLEQITPVMKKLSEGKLPINRK